MDYVKSTDKLPEPFKPVWVRVCGHRPRKMYLIGTTFFYCNKLFSHVWANASENVLWRYCKT